MSSQPSRFGSQKAYDSFVRMLIYHVVDVTIGGSLALIGELLFCSTVRYSKEGRMQGLWDKKQVTMWY